MRSAASCVPTSAVLPPAAAAPVSGCRTPILYGLAWPNASRHGAGTSIVAPSAPAAVADRPRNLRRVVLPLHHMSLVQGSLCQRSAMAIPPDVPGTGTREREQRVRLSTPNRRGGASGSGARDRAARRRNGDLAADAGGGQGAPDRVALGRGDRRERRPHVGGGDAPEQHERLLHPVGHVAERRRVETADERAQPGGDTRRVVAGSLPPRPHRPGPQNGGGRS